MSKSRLIEFFGSEKSRIRFTPLQMHKYTKESFMELHLSELDAKALLLTGTTWLKRRPKTKCIQDVQGGGGREVFD